MQEYTPKKRPPQLRWFLIVVFGFTTAIANGKVEMSQFQSRFVTQGDRTDYYRVGGTGKTTLVFVHGWASDTTVWDEQMVAFAGKTRVIAVDLPGHGRSGEPTAPYSMSLYARAIAGVLDHAGVDKAVLIGHSNGAPTIRQFYRLYPQRTRALVVVDGALRKTPNIEGAKPFIAKLKGDDYREQVAQICSQMKGVSEAFIKRITDMALRTSHSGVVGGVEAAVDSDIWNEDRIDVPTLCLMAQSPFWTPDYEAGVRAMVPELDYRVIEGANHFLHLSHPQVFQEALSEFLMAKGLLTKAP